MKFLSLAVAALVGMTEGKKTLSAQQLKTRMSKGQFNKQTLMRGAKPYGETARRLDEQQQQEEQWEINGLFSVQFSSCVSLTVQDNDLFDENFIQYAKSGELVAEKSYIIFTACKSTDCYYQAEDEKLTFVTDIASFFQAFADFLPNQVENYCEGCNQNYDYCMGNLDAQQADDGGAAGDDGGAQDQQQQQQQGDDQAAQQNNNQRRKLSAILELPSRQLANNQVVQMIDCDMCNSYECFEDQQEQGDDGKADDGAGNYEFEDALEWLDALSQCQQMENAEYNNLGLYSGLICNSDGTGVEIGVFMDDACTLYAPKLNYGKLMSYADSQYFSMSEEVVEYMFTNDFSCYQPDIQYTNPYEYQQENNDDQADNDDAYPEAAEWCNNLYNGNMDAVSLYDCGGNENADGQNDDKVNDDYTSTYAWYSYQLTQDQAEEGYNVCQVIKGLNGEKTTVYSKNNGGTMYTYKKNWANKNANSRHGMRPGGVATLVIFIILVAAGVAAFVVKSKKTGDKRAPLIPNQEGTMA